jgi:glutaredoxin
MSAVNAIHVVYARWCPHCVPTTVEPMKNAAKELGVSCVLYDIDTEACEKADELVKKFGDWSEDYTIPQVFFEFADGEFKHILTGRPEGVEYTKHVVRDFLNGPLFTSLKEQRVQAKK